MTNVSVETGLGILDAALGDGSSPGRALLGLAVLGGPAAFKILGKLSRKFRRACNSFDGETPVATENGLKLISQIKIGDKVWAYNEETGEKTLQEVVHLIAGEGSKELVDITLANGEVITATTNHPFYVDGDWLDAGELTDASQLVGLNGELLAIADIKRYRRKDNVYNLTVDNDHTYYVGDSAVLSHNAGISCNPLNIGFSDEEARVADYLRKFGRKVLKNSKENVAGAGRQGDAIVDNIVTEFKDLGPGATSSTIKNVVNKSIAKKAQAREIVLDGRGSGLTAKEATKGIHRALGASRGKLDFITVIGDDYFIGFGPL